MVEFVLSVIVYFLLLYGTFALTMWGAASFLAQEIAHECARKYAVTGDAVKAEKLGKTYLGRWGYIFIKPDSLNISLYRQGDLAVASVTVKPRINKFFIFKVEKIQKTSEAVTEDHIRNSYKYSPYGR